MPPKEKEKDIKGAVEKGPDRPKKAVTLSSPEPAPVVVRQTSAQVSPGDPPVNWDDPMPKHVGKRLEWARRALAKPPVFSIHEDR